MFENEDQSFTSGQIEIDTNQRAINHVIAFLDTYLPHFPFVFQNKTAETEITHEDDIERFKRGHHGADLAKSAMIAYIQTETCPIWHNQVNGWIRDLMITNVATDIEWLTDDLLVFQNQSNTMYKYVSMHKRMYQSAVNQIELSHYWLPLL